MVGMSGFQTADPLPCQNLRTPSPKAIKAPIKQAILKISVSQSTRF